MRKIFLIMFIAVCCYMNSWAQITAPEWETESLTIESSNCIPQHAFGLDFGLGSMSTSIPYEIDNGYYDYRDEAAFTFAFGFRYLYNLSPYFGVDFLKFNNKLSFNLESDYFAYNPQMMAGVRGNSPSFAGCMSAYAAFRLGYGLTYEWLDNNRFDDDYYYFDDGSDYLGYGACGELEVGLNINRFVFIGYAYNYQRVKRVDYQGNNGMNFHALRLGFNLGK